MKFAKHYCMYEGSQFTVEPTKSVAVIRQYVDAPIDENTDESTLIALGVIPFVQESLGRWEKHELEFTPTLVTNRAVDDPEIPQDVRDQIIADETARDAAVTAKNEAIATAILESGVKDLTWTQLNNAISGETNVVQKVAKVCWALMQRED